MERERIFRRFRVGEIRVIANVATMTVGVDLPMVSCIIDARPTRSEMCFVQTIGRGLRTAPGKDRLIVLDHAGNHIRLGCVTDLHHDRLDAGEPRRAGERAALLGRTPGIDPLPTFPISPVRPENPRKLPQAECDRRPRCGQSLQCTMMLR